MRIRLEADPEELKERGPELLARLAKALAPHNEALADALQKALPAPERPLKHKALRDLHEQLRATYARHMDMMASELAELIDGAAFQKSESPDYTTNIVAMEAAAYEKARLALQQDGLAVPEDFEEGGRFYGVSVAVLRDLLRRQA